MSHTVKDVDGLRVLVVHDMNRRYDENGDLITSTPMNDLEIVHAKDIAEYYRIPLRSIGRGDNEILGVWAMVHSNEIGQRVAYNTEETRPGNRNVRIWKVIKDASGKDVDTEEKIELFKVHHEPVGDGVRSVKRTKEPLLDELDDGMYVRLSDLLIYAEGQGWTKGGGRPGVVAPKALSAQDEKLDKLIELVGGLAQIVAHQVVAAPMPPKGSK